jgi:parallel beta-helix repeat protein
MGHPEKGSRFAKFVAKLRDSRHFNVVAAVVVGTSVAIVGYNLYRSNAATTWPVTPPAQICGNSSILGNGPTSAPVGAITVPAGNNSSVDFEQSGKTYWFAPGVHTLGTGQYSQIVPANNTTYIGAPGAILDGQNSNLYAFTQHATGVAIRYLTIQNFGKALDNNNEGVVNHDAGNNWTIEYNTIQNNAGAGVFIGDNNVIRYNCLKDNRQYGFSAYQPDGVSNVTLDHNEITGNNTDNWEARIDGCGCTGGGKFWETSNATVTNNYVHHNKSVGIWADNNNAGFLIEGNYVFENDGVGIFYETSYNAMIRNNAIIRNALVDGPQNPGFPTGGIYLSEAGSDNRVATAYNTTLDVTGNLMEDNWSGVILWENADRYCGSPANTSSGECTLVNPSVVKESTCNSTNIANAPYYHDCRWKTKNVKVYGNTFKHTLANIGGNCTFSNSCGLNGIFSNYGTYPSWSPYKGTVVQDAITYNQNNTFYNNTYEGSWRFLPFEQGNQKTFSQWQISPYNQDAGSTLNAATGNTAPTVSVTAPSDGATISGSSVSVTASASDDTSVSGVQFKVDGTNIGSEDTSSPYGVTLNTTTLTNGSHTISATARDGAGLTTTASVTVTVNNTVAAKQGDVNSDNSVNVLDLSVLLSNWGKTNSTWSNAKCDINGDGTVTVLDLSTLLSKWGT